MDALPELDEVLGRAHVVSVPLTTRFRGVQHREAVLLNGPAGWSEFSPFLEYTDAEASTWLAAALDFGWRESIVPALRRNVFHCQWVGLDPAANPAGFVTSNAVSFEVE